MQENDMKMLFSCILVYASSECLCEDSMSTANKLWIGGQGILTIKSGGVICEL